MFTHRITAVADDRGIVKTLDARLASGGEGSVFTIAGRNDLLAKIYHRQVLSDIARRRPLEAKIRDMAGHALVLRRHSQIAWPLLPLHAEGAGWCGFAMRRMPGTELRCLLGSPSHLAATCPDWHRQHLVRLCLDCLDVIGQLASHRAWPVDFNPANILVDTRSARVHWIDCDSLRFLGNQGLHAGSAITPEMAAPEIAARPEQVPVTAASVRFSVALLLFYILTLGNSPYRHRHGDDPVRNLIQGTCPLGKGAAFAFPPGSFHRIWSHLIFDLKELFIRCFRDGHSRPEARPSLEEWRAALLKYNRLLTIGHAEPSLIPAEAKSSTRKTQP